MNMRLSVSNLAWGPDYSDRILPRLAALAVAGIEVAPTRIKDWPDLGLADLAAYRAMLTDHGLVTSSLQAIFFNKPQCQLLGDAIGFAAMADHVKRIAEIGAVLGAEVAVFGAPKNRGRGELDIGDATGLATERLHAIGDILAPAGLVLGIEPVPATYAGDFLTRAGDVIDMVGRVGHPAIRVHLDTGCVMLGGDDIAAAVAAAGNQLVHFHVAEPHLAGFVTPQADHAGAAMALRKGGYARWVAIEMREALDNVLDQVESAVAFVKSVYFNV